MRALASEMVSVVFHHGPDGENLEGLQLMPRRSIQLEEPPEPPPDPSMAKLHPLSPSPPWPAEREDKQNTPIQIERQQEKLLLREIAEQIAQVAVFNQRSRPPEPPLSLHRIRAKESEALLPTTGIKPKDQLLLLPATPAPPPRHLRPAAPAETGRDRPGNSEETVRRGEVWEEKRGEERRWDSGR
jgi:hypothetical protein